ncbi:MAG: hypothetical protein M2R45_03503 [Verrucomicrobia subdivision 3 bacterium]|nr:hypothetical protein [Limisphaerales bacterium]MCS1415899.1 hypothetical protein [Limisphaerales bacterium]
MCTVTFIPTPDGYRLGMNRDEQRTRAKGGFSDLRLKGLSVLGPSEPTGGMWTCANATSSALALLNWYSKPVAPIKNPVSRGALVAALAGCRQSGETAKSQLFKQPLNRILPFRLIVVFGAEQSLREWRWDTEKVTFVDHSWSSRQWASSGYDEPAVQRSRQEVFERALSLEGAGEIEWLRSLHGSHEPTKGALSICMHRKEAATVSYTETDVDRERVRVRYCNGPLCESGWWQEREMKLETLK